MRDENGRARVMGRRPADSDSDSDDMGYRLRRAEGSARRKSPAGPTPGTPHRREILRAAARIGVNRSLKRTPSAERAQARSAPWPQEPLLAPASPSLLDPGDAKWHARGSPYRQLAREAVRIPSQQRPHSTSTARTVSSPSMRPEAGRTEVLEGYSQGNGVHEVWTGRSFAQTAVESPEPGGTLELPAAAAQRQQNGGALPRRAAEMQSELANDGPNDEHGRDSMLESASTTQKTAGREQQSALSSKHFRAGLLEQHRHASPGSHHCDRPSSSATASASAMRTAALPWYEDVDGSQPWSENANGSQKDKGVSVEDGEFSMERRSADSETHAPQRNLVSFSVKLTGHKLVAMDLSEKGDSHSVLLILQDGKQVAKSNASIKGSDASWSSMRIVLRTDQPVTLECWITSGVDCEQLIGTCQAGVEQLMTAREKFTLMNQNKKRGTICVLSVKSTTRSTRGSIVNMLQREIFISEGGQLDDEETEGHDNFLARFKLFRVYDLDFPLSVKYRTCEGIGTAKPHRHFIPTAGIAHFEAGSALTHFDVEISNDDSWEPIRDFVVQIYDVEGNGSIGVLSRTTCHIVDDDLCVARNYPAKKRRTEGFPLKPSEHVLPSCIGSDRFLTADEIEDHFLLAAFLMERWKQNWPNSFWAAFWSVYRAIYQVGMQLVVIVYIDYVWMQNDPKGPVAEKKSQALDESVNGTWAGEESAGRQGLSSESKVMISGTLALFVAFGNLLVSATDSWILFHARPGGTAKALRDWLVTQLMWADKGRLGMMRMADYLNAATSEVEVTAECWGQLFAIIERVSHFTLNLVLVLVLMPQAAFLILMLVPITFVVQRSRSAKTRELLHIRHEKQRHFVSTLADMIENTHAFRGPPMAWIRTVFCGQTAEYARSHYEVTNYVLDTAGYVEIFTGFVLGSIFFVGTILVNNDVLSPGVCLGLINAFRTGSSDILTLASIFLKLKFCSEGLRTVSRIVNFPTDAHTLAAESVQKGRLTEKFILSSLDGSNKHQSIGQEHFKPEEEQAGEMAKLSHITLAESSSKWNALRQHARNITMSRKVLEKFEDPVMCSLAWVNTVVLQGTPHKCSARRALRGAKRAHHTDPESTPLVRISARFKLGGFFQLKGPTEEDADILLRLVAGVDITQTKDSGSIYVPPFLMYTYVSESPVLLEGSILKNLLLSVSFDDRDSGDEPSAEQAWQIAQKCGLDDEYLHAPESFNVGKAGRNIPVAARQVICIARAILSDACVLMLHKPTALLTPSHSEQIFNVLKEYCDYGGLHGVLDPGGNHREFLGSKPRDFLTGRAARTVIITRPHFAAAPRQVQRIVRFAARWEEASSHVPRLISSSTMGNKVWEGESKNTATNILIRTRSIQGCTLPTKEGMVRKRGQQNTAYKDRFLACVNGCLFYYDSEAAYYKGARANGSLALSGARVMSKGFGVDEGFEWVVIEGDSERELVCASRTEGDRQGWIDAIELEGGLVADSDDDDATEDDNMKGRVWGTWPSFRS